MRRKDFLTFKSTLLICLFSAVLFTPLLLLSIMGESRIELEGEKLATRPVFRLEDFFSGSFQRQFEAWFSQKYPLRREAVNFYTFLDSKKNQQMITINRISKNQVQDLPEAAFSEFVLEKEPATELGGFRGTDTIIVGKSGYLYENGYINEYYGLTRRYQLVTDEQLEMRTAQLKFIQDRLKEKQIAFCIAITPSKASHLPQYIPDWYRAKYLSKEDYVRPYIRFKELLKKYGVYFVDSETIYLKAGITNTFPKTGTHWNKMAALLTTQALISEYEKQTGISARHFIINNILHLSEPIDNEQDIFNILYSGRETERANAIIDEKYYMPDVSIDNFSKSLIDGIIIQGGSFSVDIFNYFNNHDVATNVRRISYNLETNSNEEVFNWKGELYNSAFLVLEVNEQFVSGIGGSRPVWSVDHLLPDSDEEDNFIDILYDFISMELK